MMKEIGIFLTMFLATIQAQDTGKLYTYTF